MIHNITVVDGRHANPAKLQTQVEPVNLNHAMTMAVTSISYGEIYNIHDDNNKIYFGIKETEESADAMDTQQIFKVEIQPGTYRNTFSIVNEIVASINNMISMLDTANKREVKMFGGSTSEGFTFKLYDNIIHVENKLDTPWDLIGITQDIKASQIYFINIDLLVGVQPTFLYVNIVKNSYINGKKSRNLTVLPLKCQEGYSFYEVNNPIYVPIEVRQFSEILLELRDLNGELVKFNPKWNTVITLHFKAINRGE